MLSNRMPRGALNAIAAMVSATDEPGAKRCTRLFPASMIYLIRRCKTWRLAVRLDQQDGETHMNLFVSMVIAVGEFRVVVVAPETLVTPAIVVP